VAAPAAGHTAARVAAVAAATVPERSVSLPFLNFADLATVIDNAPQPESEGVETKGCLPCR
jgi:hypothetical protein